VELHESRYPLHAQRSVANQVDTGPGDPVTLFSVPKTEGNGYQNLVTPNKAAGLLVASKCNGFVTLEGGRSIQAFYYCLYKYSNFTILPQANSHTHRTNQVY
jgi:hypothetical protein